MKRKIEPNDETPSFIRKVVKELQEFTQGQQPVLKASSGCFREMACHTFFQHPNIGVARIIAEEQPSFGTLAGNYDQIGSDQQLLRRDTSCDCVNGHNSFRFLPEFSRTGLSFCGCRIGEHTHSDWKRSDFMIGHWTSFLEQTARCPFHATSVVLVFSVEIRRAFQACPRSKASLLRSSRGRYR